MVIVRPQLPPKKGYVEVEVDGVRRYQNADTGVLLEDETPLQTDTDLMAEAYREGVNEA